MPGYWDAWNEESLPAFPASVHVAQLHKISLRKLLEGDLNESGLLFEACQAGFFCLDVQDVDTGQALLADVETMFETAQRSFELDEASKLKHSLRPGTFFGYKPLGHSKVDAKGTPDRYEFWGLSKDDVLGHTNEPDFPGVFLKSLPAIRSFTERSHALCLLVLSHLDRYLGFPSHTLPGLHAIDQPSADQVRFLKMPPQPEEDRRISLLAHTDIGSVTLVWNILGGLQVQRADVPYNSEYGWEFIQPQRGCAIVNMGDALRRLTGNRVRSSLHRVAFAPGEQRFKDRYSVAYFSRPNEAVQIQPISFGADGTIKVNESLGVDGYRLSLGDSIKAAAQLYRDGGIPTPTYDGQA